MTDIRDLTDPAYHPAIKRITYVPESRVQTEIARAAGPGFEEQVQKILEVLGAVRRTDGVGRIVLHHAGEAAYHARALVGSLHLLTEAATRETER